MQSWHVFRRSCCFWVMNADRMDVIVSSATFPMSDFHAQSRQSRRGKIIWLPSTASHQSSLLFLLSTGRNSSSGIPSLSFDFHFRAIRKSAIWSRLGCKHSRVIIIATPVGAGRVEIYCKESSFKFNLRRAIKQRANRATSTRCSSWPRSIFSGWNLEHCLNDLFALQARALKTKVSTWWILIWLITACYAAFARKASTNVATMLLSGCVKKSPTNAVDFCAVSKWDFHANEAFRKREAATWAANKSVGQTRMPCNSLRDTKNANSFKFPRLLLFSVRSYFDHQSILRLADEASKPLPSLMSWLHSFENETRETRKYQSKRRGKAWKYLCFPRFYL